MRRPAAIAYTALVVCVLAVRPARAQTASPAGAGRIEASLGALSIGRQHLGAADMTETTPTGGALKIFTTSSELSSVFGWEGRFALRVLHSLEVEVQGSYGQPEVRVAVSSDSESAAAVTAVETVQQFTIGGGAVWYPPVTLFASRLVPFVTGGVGQLRQMHQDRILLETGRYVQVGGGVKYFFFSRPRGFVNALGARVDIRALVRTKGVAFDDSGHASPAVGVSAFVRF